MPGLAALLLVLLREVLHGVLGDAAITPRERGAELVWVVSQQHRLAELLRLLARRPREAPVLRRRLEPLAEVPLVREGAHSRAALLLEEQVAALGLGQRERDREAARAG